VVLPVEATYGLFLLTLCFSLRHPLSLAVAVVEVPVNPITPVILANRAGLAQADRLVAVSTHLHDALLKNPTRFLLAQVW
jgi:hypothetical protein